MQRIACHIALPLCPSTILIRPLFSGLGAAASEALVSFHAALVLDILHFSGCRCALYTHYPTPVSLIMFAVCSDFYFKKVQEFKL